MNDDKVKALLQSDLSMPKAPADEWGQIERKIKPPKKKFWKPFFMGLTTCCLAVFIFTNSQRSNEIAQYDEEVVEYLFSDEESEELYAWVE